MCMNVILHLPDKPGPLESVLLAHQSLPVITNTTTWVRSACGLVFLLDGMCVGKREREREMFYLTTHSTHFIYGYMASDIWLRTILIVRKETRCRHIGYSYRLAARVLLYASSHRQDNTYHGLCYTSRGALESNGISPNNLGVLQGEVLTPHCIFSNY